MLAVLLGLLLHPASARAAGVLNATFNAATDVTVTAASYTATGSTVNFTLNFAPVAGTILTVVNNTGIDFIGGTFSNLVQGQKVTLGYSGTDYVFVANYFGGNGNDLVLQWAHTQLMAWGSNDHGQIGNGNTLLNLGPEEVDATGVLAYKTLITLSCGWQSSVAVASDGTVAAWGANNDGELGNGSTTDSHVPVAVDQTGVLAGKTVIAVSSGYHVLALCSDGTVAAWGNNSNGQLGNNPIFKGAYPPNSPTPVAVDTSGVLSGKKVVAVAVGIGHSLALCSDGTLVSWGENYDGQLGIGTTADSHVPVAVDTSGILKGKTVTAIAAGGQSSYALCSDGTVAAWGDNYYGELGNNSKVASNVPVAISTSGVLSGRTVKSIAGNYTSAMVLCTDGTLATWGQDLAQPANGGSNLVPVAVASNGALSGKTPATMVVDLSTWFVRCTDGTLVGWADNTEDQYGNGTLSSSPVPLTLTPRLFSSLDRYMSLTGGEMAFHVLALAGLSGPPPPVALAASFKTAGDIPLTTAGYTATAKVVNFTLNFAPVPGTILTVINNTGLPFIDGTFSNLAQGQQVTLSYGGKDYVFVANYFGGTGNDLVLQWAGTRLMAWGDNYNSDLGTSSSTQGNVPAAVVTTGVLAGKTIIAAAAGSSHSLALCSDGTLAAWGSNYLSKLGNGGHSDSAVPVAVDTSGVLAGKTVVAIAAGGVHNLALCSDGTVAAWGSNQLGQLGNNSTANSAPNNTDQSAVPVAVDTTGVLAGKTVVAIAAGAAHSLALCSDGTLVSWGYNDEGQLGNGGTSRSNVPVAVDTTGVLAGRTVTAIAGGGSHSLALCSDGKVVSWGGNVLGVLGNNSPITTTSSTVPVAVSTAGVLAGRTVTAISAGWDHSLALCSDGTLTAWGDNAGGALGSLSVNTSSNVPVVVNAAGALAGKTVTAIAAGYGQSLALCADNTLAAWGSNAVGQLGNGSTTSSTVPVAVSIQLLGQRFVGTSSGATATHSLGLVVLQPLPQMVVQQPAGTGVISGVQVDFGGSKGGSVTSKTFTIANTGTGPLSIAGVTIDGANAADFTITASPATPVAAGSGTSLTVAFSASASGSRSAVLHINSDDPTTANFQVNLTGTGNGTAVSTTFNTATDVPVTAASYTAAGSTVNFTLNFAPATGTTLTVINNTGIDFISGAFNNLAQGQQVTLSYHGIDYVFVASYFGGNGNDLVLQWANTQLMAWGGNFGGEFGNDTISSTTVGSAVPVPVNSRVLAGKTLVAVAAGQMSSVALASDGTLAAWGSAILPGNGSEYSSAVPVAVDRSGVLAGKTVVAISTTLGHVLALCSDGTVAAWGGNTYGQLGNNPAPQTFKNSDGTTVSYLPNGPSPVAVVTTGVLAGKKVVAVATGFAHSLALCSDGTVAAWGGNTDGQLGNGTNTQSNVPVAVDRSGALAGKTVVAIDASFTSSVALCSDGTVVGWGYNGSGELGNNSIANSNVPVAVVTTGVLAGRKVRAIAASNNSVAGLCSDGTLAVWGSAAIDQGGNGQAPVALRSLGALAGKAPASISGGYLNFFVRCTDGTFAAWGDNTYGEFGNGSTTGGDVPLALAPALPVAGSQYMIIRSGSQAFHTLAVAALPEPADLTASFNMAGDIPLTTSAYSAGGRMVNFSLNFVPAAGTALTVVNNTGLAFIKGTFNNLAQGQEITLSYGGNSYVFIANYFGGTGNDLVLQWAGTQAVAWGADSHGELGDGNSLDSALPVPVTTSGALAGKHLIALAAGELNSAAVAADGTVFVWGDNSYGQLGNGTKYLASHVPVAVSPNGALAGKTVVAVSVGWYHVLALCSDGTVAAWGSNYHGQLGNGAITDSSVPVAVNTQGVLNGRQVVAVCAGTYFSLALCSDGTTVTWGQNDLGQLGNGTTTNSLVPVAVNASGVLNGRQAAAAAVGSAHCLVLCTDGTLVKWGDARFGQLGNGTISLSSLVPVTVTTSGVLAGKTVKAISAGSFSSLVLCTDGSLAAWGDNTYGQLGDGTNNSASLPVAVAGAGAFAGRVPTAIASGFYTSYALCDDGTLATWGVVQANAFAPAHSTLSSNVPVPVEPSFLPAQGETFVTVTSGSAAMQTLALITVPPAGSLPVYPPGAGPLYIGFTSATDVGIHVSSYTANGSSVDLALDFAPAAGTVLTVIDNAGLDFIHGAFSNLSQGQVVNLTYNGVNYPFVANYYGGTGNDLVLQWAQCVPMAWGINSTGQFGNGTTDPSGQLQPPALTKTNGVLKGKILLSITAAQACTVAVASDGTVATWGAGDSGQLGNGRTTGSPVPVAVSTAGVLKGKKVIAASANDAHMLALCDDGTVVAWGNNDYGQLGNNPSPVTGLADTAPPGPFQLTSYLPGSSVPVAVDTSGVLNGKKVVAVSAGADHSLALCSDGSVVSWGNNTFGQLGTGSSIAFSTVPVRVDTSGALFRKAVVAVCAGIYFDLALCSDGTVVGWGTNQDGQLGTGTTSIVPMSAPVAVDTSGVLKGKFVKAITATSNSSLALCTDGTLVAWGVGETGTLGNNDTHSQVAPVAVTIPAALAGQKPVAIAASAITCFAQWSDGTLTAWGSSGYGQFGTGIIASSLVPLPISPAILPVPGQFMTIGVNNYAFHTAALIGLPVKGQPNIGAPALAGLGLTTADPLPPVDYPGSGPLNVRFNLPTDIGVTAGGYSANGSDVSFFLAYHLTPGTNLTVINNTSGLPIRGTFNNLALEWAADQSPAGGDATPDLTAAANVPLLEATIKALAAGGSYSGLLTPSRGASPSLMNVGGFSATVQASGAFTARLMVQGRAQPIVGVFDSRGAASFGPKRTSSLTLVTPQLPDLVLTLARNVTPFSTPGSAITGTISQAGGGGVMGSVAADLLYYDGRTFDTTVPQPWYTSASTGLPFTVILPARDLRFQSPGMTSADFPQGAGFGSLRLTRAGVGTLAINLPDGTSFIASVPVIRHYGNDDTPRLTLPLFAPLYGGGGLVTTTLTLDSSQMDSDASAGADGLLWLRPVMISQYYPRGWPQGITTDVLAARYLVQAGASVVIGTPGNASLVIDEGLLTSPFSRVANLSASDTMTPFPANDRSFTLAINRTTGVFGGTFLHTDGTRPAYRGTVYQRGAYTGGHGFFLTTTPHRHTGQGQGGVVTLSAENN